MQLPNLLIHPCDNDGCGFYRVRQPAQYLSSVRPINVIMEASQFLTREQVEHYKPEWVLNQRAYNPKQLSFYESYKSWGLKMLTDLDDLLWQVPENNPFKKLFKKEHFQTLKTCMNISDRLVSSTEPLKEEMRKLARYAPITVLPNFISKDLRNSKPTVRKDKLRVGWAGSPTHQFDLSQIEYVVQSTLDKYQWVFMWYCPPSLQHKVEFHQGSKINYVDPSCQNDTYYNKLRSLELDVAIAPLIVNRFNECKSHIKLLEYSAMSVPTITTKIHPYYENPNYSVVSHRRQYKEWLDILDAYDTDDSLRIEHGTRAFEWSKKYHLECNAQTIEDAWFN